MDAFMKDGLNVKPVLLKQNAPEMDAFQQRLFNSQHETYVLLKPDAPKNNAFHVKDVVNIEPFLFDTNKGIHFGGIASNKKGSMLTTSLT